MTFWPPPPEDSYAAIERELALLDPAFAKCALALRGELRFGHKAGSLNARSLPKVVEELNVYRRQFEAGEVSVLLIVVDLCAREVLPLPTWAALPLLDRLRAYATGDMPSLDDVFGAPLPARGKAARRARQDLQLGRRLWGHVVFAQAHKGIASFDAALRYAVEQEGSRIGATKARKLVLEAEKSQSRHLGPRVRQFSHLRRRTRKT